jgi:hypothetical protein
MTNNHDDEEQMIEYVFIPDENVYGTIVRYGAWSSLIEYFEGGIGYRIEVPNDEYITVDEIGVGYVNEGLDYINEEEDDL